MTDPYCPTCNARHEWPCFRIWTRRVLLVALIAFVVLGLSHALPLGGF